MRGVLLRWRSCGCVFLTLVGAFRSIRLKAAYRQHFAANTAMLLGHACVSTPYGHSFTRRCISCIFVLAEGRWLPAISEILAAVSNQDVGEKFGRDLAANVTGIIGKGAATFRQEIQLQLDAGRSCADMIGSLMGLADTAHQHGASKGPWLSAAGYVLSMSHHSADAEPARAVTGSGNVGTGHVVVNVASADEFAAMDDEPTAVETVQRITSMVCDCKDHACAACVCCVLAHQNVRGCRAVAPD